jgi:hypothetical protein
MPERVSISKAGRIKENGYKLHDRMIKTTEAQRHREGETRITRISENGTTGRTLTTDEQVCGLSTGRFRKFSFLE